VLVAVMAVEYHAGDGGRPGTHGRNSRPEGKPLEHLVEQYHGKKSEQEAVARHDKGEADDFGTGR
jgi:hypothetical protein